MKYNDLGDKEKINFKTSVDVAASPFGDRWETWEYVSNDCPDYGLCNDCSEAYIYKKQYSGWNGKCNMWDKRLNPIDPVLECMQYTKKGQLSLEDMKSIAEIIDIDKKKIGIV